MQPPLSANILIVELGERLAAAAGGSLLRELGATVIVVEPADAARDGTKWALGPNMAAGKRNVSLDDNTESRDAIAALIDRADAVIASSDLDRPWPEAIQAALNKAAIVCDVTAFGRDATGAFAGPAFSDGMLQSIAGFVDITGDGDEAPIACRAPVLEFSSGIYAAASVLLALRARDSQGIAQHVALSIFDNAFSQLTTFLPRHLTGAASKRIGNHHPGMSPWNTYRASDGWVMICSGSNEQWLRICQMIGRPDLATDERYSTPTLRLSRNAEIDDLVGQWVGRQTISECIGQLDAANIPVSPVARVADIFTEPNLLHRGIIDRVETEQGPIRFPGVLFRGTRNAGRKATAMPKRGEANAQLHALLPTARRPATSASAPASAPPQPVLQGVRVLEMGQYTTAPLCTRILGALGADIVKIEPPAGDPARGLPPLRDGVQSYFFTMSNGDKRSIAIDMRSPAAKPLFTALVGKADILVENMKPGALAKFGFGAAELEKINPRLIYCAISGFGDDAPDRGRGAMDTTIQAAAGIMDLIRQNDTPYKHGVSLMDITGGQMGMLFVLAALEARNRTGLGQFIDLSMLDAAAWMTQLEWNGATTGSCAIHPCGDGYVALPQDAAEHAARHADKSRDALCAHLAAQGIAASPVLSITEAAEHALVSDRNLLVDCPAPDTGDWPLFACPIRLAKTPPKVSRALGSVGIDQDAILRDWGLTPAP